jgi:hypothetical protein
MEIVLGCELDIAIKSIRDGIFKNIYSYLHESVLVSYNFFWNSIVLNIILVLTVVKK